MRIYNSAVEVPRASPARAVQATPSDITRRQTAGQTATQTRSDSVQISDAGRALASQTGAVGESRTELSAERIGEIRNRILQGAYNSLEVVDEVARRMLASGDI